MNPRTEKGGKIETGEILLKSVVLLTVLYQCLLFSFGHYTVVLQVANIRERRVSGIQKTSVVFLQFFYKSTVISNLS